MFSKYEFNVLAYKSDEDIRKDNEKDAKGMVMNLYNRIKDSLVEVEYENKKYTPIGINPAFRFIEYMDNGYLVPHYDFIICWWSIQIFK